MAPLRRLAMVLGIALFALANLGRAQSLSKQTPGLRPHSGPEAPRLVACGPTSISESSSTTVTAGNSGSCNTGGFHNDSHYWRAFDLASFGLTSDFHVCEVTIGVESADSVSGSQPLTVNLYTSSQAFPAGYPGSLTLIGTTATTVADQSLSLATFPVTGTAPSGSQLVVEIFTPSGVSDGNSFVIGSNAAAETAPSYFSAPACGIPTPTATADVGFPNMHIVMTVDGTATGPVSLAVDPPPPGGSGNGVLELGESAVIAPSWKNGGATDFSLTGIASNLTGPFGPIYTIEDPTADYDVIASGASATCTDCYTINISGPRFVQHFDATMDETVTASPLTIGTGLADSVTKTWTLHVGASFSDVSIDTATNPFYPFIETIFHNGVTAGCGDGSTYCPLQNVLRQEMAVFMLKASQTSSYTPPACTPPGIFTDVLCPGLYTDWIEDLFNRGITAGCAADPGPPPTMQYCPTADILRQEMAVFLIKTQQGSGYTPPACTPPGIFSDVPCPGLYTDWIEDAYNRGITAGCSSDPGPPPTIQFCPTSPVTREQMAAFLTTTFGLVLYGP